MSVCALWVWVCCVVLRMWVCREGVRGCRHVECIECELFLLNKCKHNVRCGPVLRTCGWVMPAEDSTALFVSSSGILPIVPAALGAMLDVENCQNEDIREFMPLITQIIMKFKTKVAPVLEDFFLPVVQASLALLRVEVDPADENAKADQMALRRCYFEFLNCCISNSLAGVLVAPKNAAHTPEILSTVLRGGVEYKDAQSQKICFNMLQKLIRLWLGKAEVGLAGFDDFVLTQIVPTCFQSVLKPDFNPDDGWSYLVLGEIAALLLATYSVAGSTLVQFLQNVFFPSIPLPQDVALDIVACLESEDKQKVRQCLKLVSQRLVHR
eukprot:m.788211 g.788211  ORF g.788211 m.788211 type:complete len:325 (-) comp23315_c0_seq3:144-1118(-)